MMVPTIPLTDLQLYVDDTCCEDAYVECAGVQFHLRHRHISATLSRNVGESDQSLCARALVAALGSGWSSWVGTTDLGSVRSTLALSDGGITLRFSQWQVSAADRCSYDLTIWWTEGPEETYDPERPDNFHKLTLGAYLNGGPIVPLFPHLAGETRLKRMLVCGETRVEPEPTDGCVSATLTVVNLVISAPGTLATIDGEDTMVYPFVNTNPTSGPQVNGEQSGYESIDLAAEFPVLWMGPGDLYGAKTFGPYDGDRWVYSHEDDPAGANDDLVINGEVIEQNDFADIINGGATTLMLFLPAGDTFTVDVLNSIIYGAEIAGGGSLRLYAYELPASEPFVTFLQDLSTSFSILKLHTATGDLYSSSSYLPGFTVPTGPIPVTINGVSSNVTFYRHTSAPEMSYDSGSVAVVYDGTACVFWNTEQTFTAVCPEGLEGEDVTKVVPAHTFMSTVSLAAANAAALASAEAQAEADLVCEEPEPPETYVYFLMPGMMNGAAQSFWMAVPDSEDVYWQDYLDSRGESYTRQTTPPFGFDHDNAERIDWCATFGGNNGNYPIMLV